MSPLPTVKHGTKLKLRARNKNGKIRKLRSDKGKKRKEASEEDKDFVVVPRAEWLGQVHVPHSRLSEFADLVHSNPSEFIFKGTVESWMKRCGLVGEGSSAKSPEKEGSK